jgi:hypothetical protein
MFFRIGMAFVFLAASSLTGAVKGGEQSGEPAAKPRPDLRIDPKLEPSPKVMGPPAIEQELSVVPRGNDDFLADKEAPPKDDAARLEWLLKNRRETARHCVGGIRGAYDSGLTTSDRFTGARIDELKAELALCRTAAERIKVREEVLRVTGRAENRVRAKREAGVQGGRAVDYAVAQATRLDAAIALLRERLPIAEGTAAEEDKARLKMLLPARRNALQKAIEAADAEYGAGTCTAELPLGVSRDLLQAELELWEDAAHRIAARERNLQQLKTLEDRVKEAERGRGKTGSTLDYWQSKAARLDAEIGLVRERLVGANDERAQTDGARLKRLVTDRHDTFRKCAECAKKAHDAGTASLDQVLDAQKRMIDCELETCQDPTQRIALREQLVKMSTQMEGGCRARYEVGGPGGSPAEYAAAKVARLDAEIALVRERLKTKSAPK